MFTIRNDELMGTLSGSIRALFVPVTIGLTLLGTPPAFADEAVNLKVLVVTTGDITQDAGLAYIQPVLDEMGVPYDVLNAATTELTATMLNPTACVPNPAPLTAVCVGSYNGIILTDSIMATKLTPEEWDVLHRYEKSFQVREAVLSGWPGSNPPYLDYGLSYVSSITSTSASNAQWAIPAASSKTVFEYVNTANPLAITDFAYTAKPRNDNLVLGDGTVPSVTPLLKASTGDALVSVIQYKNPSLPTIVEREVMLSTISNAWFLTHSQVLSYEFINWVTKGVFVGGRFVHMTNHLDDLFLANDLWDPNTNTTSTKLTYRLNSTDITNAVSKQAAFRTAHPTAGAGFKLDFAFNGAGAVLDPAATTLALNSNDDLVNAFVSTAIKPSVNAPNFRYINHTFTHADMDKAPTATNTACDYSTLPTIEAIQTEITNNQIVWGLLGLPHDNGITIAPFDEDQVLVSGNHSGLKDRKCTDYPELHPTMFNVQSDDVPYVAGANPLFLEAAANLGVDYLASDTSQVNQGIEHYISGVNDGSNRDRIMCPRFPTNVFYNVINPKQLESEYNYIFRDRFLKAGQDPCTIAGAVCKYRTYNEILAAEATAAIQHMLSFKKYPHFFHQGNIAKYDANGNTLQFDWLNSVFTAYEKLFKLPVKNFPYYEIGNKTEERLIAKSAKITAIWNRTTKQVTLSADKNVPNLLVTGINNGGDVYGGQFLREISVNKTPKVIPVNQALTQ